MAKFELKLFVKTNCPKCPAAKAVAQELVTKRSDLELKILDIGDHENYLSALMLQITSTPAFAVKDDVLFVGNAPSLEKLNNKLDELAKRNGL